MNTELPIDEKKEQETLPKPDVKEWLSPVEAAEYSGLSKPRMYQMISDMLVVSKDIPGNEREHKGPHKLVLRDSIDTYMANRDQPRERVSETATKYIPRSPPIAIDNDELRDILNVPLKDLIQAYKERRIDRTVYSLRDAAKITGLKLEILTKMVELKMVRTVKDGDRIGLNEETVMELKNKNKPDDDIVTI